MNDCVWLATKTYTPFAGAKLLAIPIATLNFSTIFCRNRSHLFNMIRREREVIFCTAREKSVFNGCSYMNGGSISIKKGKLLTSHRSTIYPCYLPVLGEFNRSWSYKTCLRKYSPLPAINQLNSIFLFCKKGLKKVPQP